MIEIKIPKEINKYEAKLIGMFTTRQTVCIGITCVLCILTYNILKPIDSNIASFACFIVAAPFVLCGWYKPYGMHFEQFFKTMLMSSFLAPAKRKYKSRNLYEILSNDKLEAGKKAIKKKYKKSKKAYK